MASPAAAAKTTALMTHTGRAQTGVARF